MIKGIILLGGSGTRLGTYTRRCGNKACLPIYNRLSFEYPLNTLVSAGITDITIIVGERYAGDMINIIGDGKEWGVTSINYLFQVKPDGIASAINLAKPYINSKVCVILGDNFFSFDVKKYASDFDLDSSKGCRLFLKSVLNPKPFGVCEVDKDRIISIEEKPNNPKSNLIATGLYFYDETVFDKINKLVPSKRGELEVTSLNMEYVKENSCYGYDIGDSYWSDMGTFDSILNTANWVKDNNFKLMYEFDAWEDKHRRY